MDTRIDAKAFEMKLGAELEKTQARLQQLEARAREQKAQAAIDAIDAARRLVSKINKTRQSLHEATGNKVAEVQSEIEAAKTQLNESLEKLALKLKGESSGSR